MFHNGHCPQPYPPWFYHLFAASITHSNSPMSFASGRASDGGSGVDKGSQPGSRQSTVATSTMANEKSTHSYLQLQQPQSQHPHPQNPLAMMEWLELDDREYYTHGHHHCGGGTALEEFWGIGDDQGGIWCKFNIGEAIFSIIVTPKYTPHWGWYQHHHHCFNQCCPLL